MCISMYYKIQSDQPRITQNVIKSQIFDLFTKSLSGHFQFKAFFKHLVLFLLITLNFKVHKDTHFWISFYFILLFLVYDVKRHGK